MKLTTALTLGRISNLPTVWSNILVGLVLCGHSAATLPFLLVGCSGSLMYLGGMFLNDAFDAEYDCRVRAERPIPRGEVDTHTVFVWGFCALAVAALIIFGLGLLRIIDIHASIVAAGLGAVIVGYDVWHKGNPVAPILMGVCRVGLYWLGAVAVAGTVPKAVLVASVLLLAYVTGITYVARSEADDSVEHRWPLALLYAPMLIVAWSTRGLGLPILVAFAIWTSQAVSFIRRGGPDNIRIGVSRLIGGISLVDALFLARFDTTAALGALLAFGLTIALHRRVAGT